MNLLILGPQGAGKGTQAVLLASRLGIPHISTGDIFRSNLKVGTKLGKKAQKYMDVGELVPDSITREMVAERLTEADAQRGFLLDGFPRTMVQATWLKDELANTHRILDRVLLLTAPDEQLVSRMLARGRSDDTPEAISRRLDIYRANTQPLLDFYGDLVSVVDGVGAIDEVQHRLLSQLGPV